MNRTLLLLAAALACSGSPSGGDDPEPIPGGTILAGTPNGQEAGSYLADVASGSVTKIATGQDPLTVAFQGGYSAANKFVYGVSTLSPPDRIMAVSLATGDTSLVIEMPNEETLMGTLNLSPDGGTLAIQIQYWPTGEIHLYTIELDTGIWSPIVDQATGIDTIPLTGLQWSPDGNSLYAVIDVYPNRCELVRIDLASQEFQIISPTTQVNGSLDVSPDGRVLAYQDGDGLISFRDRYGNLLDGFPEVEAPVIRPRFSPDGKFLAYQTIVEGVGEGPIVLMRLSDGKRWPLKINAGFTVWLADWF